MITRQRGDQRRRKFHVYISTVCLFRIIYISITSIEDDTGERAREDKGVRARTERKKTKSLNYALLTLHKNL